MDICRNHKDGIVIVHDEAVCPLCDAYRQIDEWEKQDDKFKQAMIYHYGVSSYDTIMEKAMAL